MKRRWVIPDTHGCSKTVEALIRNIIRPTRYDGIWFLGDYIDRGPDSKGVINFIRSLRKDEYNVTALKGNHEDMAVELYDAERDGSSSWKSIFGNRKRSTWLEMGGKETLKSYGVSNARDLPADHVEWMRDLPYYAKLDDFVLVHAGLNFKNEDPFEDTLSMLWLREFEIKPEKIGFRRIVHGHVPVNLELITLAVRNKIYKFIDLDNGIYMSGREGYGNLVALELNSMEFVIQDNLDL